MQGHETVGKIHYHLVVGGKQEGGIFFFVEPDSVEPGDRVFDIVIQDEKVLSDFDIRGVAGESNQACVQTVTGVRADGQLTIKLIPVTGKPPRLCGLAIAQEL